MTFTPHYNHTPPPWQIIQGNGAAEGASWISRTTINKNAATRIATIEGSEYWAEEHQANIRLIALSPELLETLGAIVLTLSPQWVEEHEALYDKAVKLIRQVISSQCCESQYPENQEEGDQ